MSLQLAKENPLLEIPYVKVLTFAAERAANTGKRDSSGEDVPGFTFQDISGHDSIRDISPRWLEKILPSICTVHDADGKEVTGSPNYAQPNRFVIKSEEFIKFANLLQVDRLAGLLTKTTKLLEKSDQLLEKSDQALKQAKDSVSAANTLVTEARSSGTKANYALFAACLAVLAAIVVPPLVVKTLNTTVDVVKVNMNDKDMAELLKKVGEAPK